MSKIQSLPAKYVCCPEGEDICVDKQIVGEKEEPGTIVGEGGEEQFYTKLCLLASDRRHSELNSVTSNSCLPGTSEWDFVWT